MNLPVPPELLKPLLDQALKLATSKIGKGNPFVGDILAAGLGLLDQHGANLPTELKPIKRQISASLTSDFAAMDAAADRAKKAGQFKG